MMGCGLRGILWQYQGYKLLHCRTDWLQRSARDHCLVLFLDAFYLVFVSVDLLGSEAELKMSPPLLMLFKS